MNARVLVIGLDPAPRARAVGPRAGRVGRRPGHDGPTAAGIDAVPCWVGVDGSDGVPAVVTDVLRDGSWDCVLVGGGLRGGDVVLPGARSGPK